MKHILSYLFLSTALFLMQGLQAHSQETSGHQIEVKVKNFTGAQAYLAYHLGSKQYIQDTVDVQNGKILFEGPEPLEKGIYMVVLPPENRYFEVMVGEDQHFTMQTDSEDLINKMKVAGSEDNEVFYEHQRLMTTIGQRANEMQNALKEMEKGSEAYKAKKAEVDKVYQEMNASRKEVADLHPNLLYAKVINAMMEPEAPEVPEGADDNYTFYYFQKHWFDNVDFSESGLIRTPVLQGKITNYVDRLAVQHYDSLKEACTRVITAAEVDKDVYQFATITLLNKYASSKIMCQEAVYVHIVDMVYAAGKAWWADEEQIKKILERANALRWTLCGKVAPDMVMKDTEGKTRSMQQSAGEFTILYFWDYDCGHCKKITPKVGKLFPKYKDKNVKLWTVSINGNEETWKERLKTYGLDDIGAFNMSDHERKTGFDYYYDIRSTPRIFLIDKDKRIMAKQISPEQLEDILDSQLEMDDTPKVLPKKDEVPIEADDH